MPAHRLWMKSGASGRAIYLNHSAVDHQEDADGKYLRTQPHEHALEPQPQQGTHAPVGKLGLQIAHHAGDVDARIRDDDPRRLADHILRHIEHRHDDVPGVRDDQHRAEGFENPPKEEASNSSFTRMSLRLYIDLGTPDGVPFSFLLL